MARIRTIKPEFWEDEKVAELPIEARLLFIGMWNFADDNGVFPDSTKWIKAKVFPYDTPLRDHIVTTWVNLLVQNGMLNRFEYEGKSFLIIRTFSEHQIIDKRYKRETIPLKSLPDAAFKNTTTCSHSDHIVTTPQELERKGSGKEVEGSNARPGAHADALTHTRTRTREQAGAREEEIELIMPWPGQKFSENWDLWKKFKREQFRFSYKKISEQAALKELAELSAGDEDVAIAIIHQSISKGWQGLFELKLQTKNGNRKEQPTDKRPIVAAAEEVLRRASGEDFD